MIDKVAVDTSEAPKVIRSRVDQATACYYPQSNRVIVMADKQDFGAALRALTELREHVMPALAEEKMDPLP